MYKKLGYLAAGVVVGLVVTGYLVNKEIQEEKEKAEAYQKELSRVLKENPDQLKLNIDD